MSERLRYNRMIPAPIGAATIFFAAASRVIVGHGRVRLARVRKNLPAPARGATRAS